MMCSLPSFAADGERDTSAYKQRLQKGKELVGKATELMARRKSKLDTLYLQRPKYDWTLRLRYTIGAADVGIKTIVDNEVLRADLTSHTTHSVGFGVNYKGIGLNFSINANMFQKKKDENINLQISSYTNRYGFELQYQSTNTFSGKSWDDWGEYKLDEGCMDKEMFLANTYYAFNYKKFSFPAAFTQSYIQRRSAGSFLIGVSAIIGNFHTNFPPDDDFFFHFKSTLGLYNAGVGYGYNFVIKKKFLLHLSLLPNLMLINTTRMNIDGQSRSTMKSFPDFNIIGRVAFVYNLDRYFVSLTTTNNYSYFDRSEYYYYYRKIFARIAFGYRL